MVTWWEVRAAASKRCGRWERSEVEARGDEDSSRR
jgi:hypothetical protein